MKTIKIKASEVSMYSFEWKSFFKKILAGIVLVGSGFLAYKKVDGRLNEKKILQQLDLLDANLIKLQEKMDADFATMKDADLDSIYQFKNDLLNLKQSNLQVFKQDFNKIKENKRLRKRYLESKDRLESFFISFEKRTEDLIKEKVFVAEDKRQREEAERQREEAKRRQAEILKKAKEEAEAKKQREEAENREAEEAKRQKEEFLKKAKEEAEKREEAKRREDEAKKRTISPEEARILSQLTTLYANLSGLKIKMHNALNRVKNASAESLYKMRDDSEEEKQALLKDLKSTFYEDIKRFNNKDLSDLYSKVEAFIKSIFTEVQEEIDKLIASKQDDPNAKPTSRINHALSILGLEPNDLDPDKVKATYRKLSKKYHPDLNPGDKKAEDMFKKIGAAKEVIDKYFAEVNKKMAAFICASILRNIKYNTI